MVTWIELLREGRGDALATAIQFDLNASWNVDYVQESSRVSEGFSVIRK